MVCNPLASYAKQADDAQPGARYCQLEPGPAGPTLLKDLHLALSRGKGSRQLLPPLIGVADTTKALGDLAAGHRARFEGTVVAITGSNGKTTTKEMCAAILSQRTSCLKNEGNLNNQFGLPLTLLRREPSHRVAVVELGMNHRGEIAALTAIAKPDIAETHAGDVNGNI